MLVCVYMQSINDGIQVTESTPHCSYAAMSAQNVKCAFKLNSLMNSWQRLATDHRLNSSNLLKVLPNATVAFLSD